MTERSDRLRGVVMMLTAVGAFSIMDALMKVLTARYPAVQVAFFRGAASLPFVFLSMPWPAGCANSSRCASGCTCCAPRSRS